MNQLQALYGRGVVVVNFPPHQGMRQIVAEYAGHKLYQLLDGGADGYFVVVDGVPGAARVPLNGVAYVAGPMRGLPEYNFPAFDAARDLLISDGYYVFNPADMDRMIGVNEKTEKFPAHFMRDAMDRDLNAITKCSHVALLPGWAESRGVRPEAVLAYELGLVFLSLDSTGYEKVPGEAVVAVVGGRLVGIYQKWNAEQKLVLAE